MNKPRTGARRNSTGKASRTISPSLSNTDEKPVPNYLRASTGSCHDLCKYGIKHVFETKKRLPISIKFAGNNGTTDEGQNQAKALTPQERRKRPELKSKLSQAVCGHIDEVITPKDLRPEKVIQLSDTPIARVEEPYVECVSTQLVVSLPTGMCVAFAEHVVSSRAEESSEELEIITLSFQESIASAEHAPTDQAEGSSIQKSIISTDHTSADQAEGSSEEQNQVNTLNAGDRKRREVNKLRTSQKKAETSIRAEVIKHKTSDASMKKKAASPVRKTITSIKPTSTVQRIPSSVNKAIAPLACSIIQQKVPSPPKADDVSAGRATSLKHKDSASPSISRGGLEKKIIGSPGPSKIGEEKVLKPLKTCVSTKPPVIQFPSMKLRKLRNMKPSCPVKSQAKVDRSAEKLDAKTLYAVELKPGKVVQKNIKQKPSKPGSYPLSHSSPSASSLMSSHDSGSTLSENVSAVDKEGTEQRSKAAVSKVTTRGHQVELEVFSVKVNL